MVGAARLHHDHVALRHAAGRGLALCHARPRRPRLSEPHHLRGGRAAATHRLSSWRRRRCRAGAVCHHGHVRRSPRQNPHYHADGFRVGGRARPRDQGIRRRPGSGADAGAARTACRQNAGRAVTMPLAEREITITRTFDAPRALVFEAWTDAKVLAQWWGPQGFTNPRCEFDAKVGGVIRIDMRAPDGAIYPMQGEVREIVSPERLVFTNMALDANGSPVTAGLTTVTF